MSTHFSSLTFHTHVFPGQEHQNAQIIGKVKAVGHNGLKDEAEDDQQPEQQDQDLFPVRTVEAKGGRSSQIKNREHGKKRLRRTAFWKG